jgi:tartrate dehydratase alpha subunit/fumarate hydratase class I-like protein
MGRILTCIVVATSLLAIAASEASAWTCLATGVGANGMGRSYTVIDAKLMALRRCERTSPVPICTIVWCRPR